VRYITSGTAVADVGLAVNDRVKRGEEWVDETTFVDITFWARTAEVLAKYCKKGSSILVEGRLKLDQWEQDGQKRQKLKVIGEKMQMLDKKGGGGGGQQPRSQNRTSNTVQSRANQAVANQDAYSEPIDDEEPPY
jgi:single-strand DNA-binding protein